MIEQLKNGDLIKESWYFHGFEGNGLFDLKEVVSTTPNFRFGYFDSSINYSIGRVNCMGWPVSTYKVEKVKEEEINSIKSDKTYIFDSSYDSWRTRQEWDNK